MNTSEVANLLSNTDGVAALKNARIARLEILLSSIKSEYIDTSKILHHTLNKESRMRNLAKEILEELGIEDTSDEE